MRMIITYVLMCLCAYVSTVLFTFSLSSQASPTSNEFKQCSLIATKTLEACLASQANPFVDEDNCWVESKSSYDNCITDVFKRHSPDEQQAKKQAAEKAERQRRLEAMDNANNPP